RLRPPETHQRRRARRQPKAWRDARTIATRTRPGKARLRRQAKGRSRLPATASETAPQIRPPQWQAPVAAAPAIGGCGKTDAAHVLLWNMDAGYRSIGPRDRRPKP